MLTGLMSIVVATCLTSRISSTRPSIAVGWELEVLILVVLGGIDILGGSGSIPGVVIAAFVMGMVTCGSGRWLWRDRHDGKYAFRMRLLPGQEAEYQRRHDAVWLGLVTLLKAAGISNYSIHLGGETGILFGVRWRSEDHTMDDLPASPVMQRWWDIWPTLWRPRQITRRLRCP